MCAFKRKKHDLSKIKMQKIKAQDFGAIYVTKNFVNDINKIYGDFTVNDNEYPALGVTIAESPIFVECLHYPDEAIIRRRMTDEIIGDHPSIKTMWNNVLDKYQGKCRYASVHIHPMDLPRPSSVDISNYERVRTNPNAFNTFEGDKPFPFILINLHGRTLHLLGFWVMNGECYKCQILHIDNADPMIESAWNIAPPLAYYSEESRCVRRVQNTISSKWSISLAVKNGTTEKAMKVADDQGNRFILAFDNNRVLGLSNPLLDDGKIVIEEFINWENLFEELADATKTLALEKEAKEKAEEEAAAAEEEEEEEEEDNSNPEENAVETDSGRENDNEKEQENKEKTDQVENNNTSETKDAENNSTASA